MDAALVYAKTPLGQDEIVSRARRLPARTRTVLIMVDGRHSASELLANSPVPAEAEAHLLALLEGGFIAPVEATQAEPSDVPDEAIEPGGGSGS